MIKTFTPDDVIKYVYKECNQEEQKDIEEAMLSDEKLKETYQYIINLKDDLDKAEMSPSNKTINNILEYSKNYKANKGS
ncbi:hypothetical protein [Marinigracilibium pacificum]|uniref:Uncharacterized protein n=1 Tax=Marinigracilibium pacificum TaxID=2729599 RepID=A0A848IXV3_9BACT|nr:hypothetical protein [Marinigracilibium pacificum]NMM47074.1 hypothetical protein [Marinigracilibium pacificum]